MFQREGVFLELVPELAAGGGSFKATGDAHAARDTFLGQLGLEAFDIRGPWSLRR